MYLLGVLGTTETNFISKVISFVFRKFPYSNLFGETIMEVSVSENFTVIKWKYFEIWIWLSSRDTKGNMTTYPLGSRLRRTEI
jgi:hypothetical protein